MSKNIGIILSLKDKFSPKIKDIAAKLNITEKQAKNLDRALAQTSKNMRKSFDNMANASFIAAGAFAALSVKSAADFEQGMNNVATLIDTNVESLDEMKKGVLDIAKDSPKAIGDLTDALYNIRSAGMSADEQFNVLKGSEKLAVAGLATTAEAVDIATSAINAFGLKGEEANGVYDMFFKAVKFGKTNVAEFAQGFGAVAGVVASADIDLKEYTASVAAMTTTGVKASIAHTQLKAVIAGLSRNSKEQNKVFKELGAKSFKDLIAKSGGMVQALEKVKKAVGGDEPQIIKLSEQITEYIEAQSTASNEVFKTPSIDFVTPCINVASGAPVLLSGVDAIKQWIVLFVTTPRDVYDIYYGTDFGTTLRKLYGRKIVNNGYAESELTRQIKEGLSFSCSTGFNVNSVI